LLQSASRQRRTSVSLRTVLLSGLLLVVLSTIGLVSLSITGVMRKAAQGEARRSAETLLEAATASADVASTLHAFWEQGLIDGYALSEAASEPQQRGLEAIPQWFAELDRSTERAEKQSTQGGRKLLMGRGLEDGRRVLVSLPMAAFEAPLSQVQSLLLLYLFLSSALVVFLGAFFLRRSVERPVRRLLDATEQVARGDLGAQVRQGGIGELSELSARFNEMVTALRRARDELEASLEALRASHEELSEANEELARRHAQLLQAQHSLVRSEKLATVGQLAAGVAHEIGNPLSSLMAYVSMLEEEELEASEESRILKEMADATQRMRRIISELLDYSRSRESELEFMSAASAIEQALRLVAPQPRFRGIQVENRTAEVSLEAWLDEPKLVQVLVNLLLNAADAMGATGRIVMEAEADEAQLRLRVSDSGPGIPAELQRQVFEPFFTTKEPGKGTGLGLAICERSMADMAGELALRPSESGCVFELRLSRSQARPQLAGGS
jgi:C4-dicarboxylate-specific signal transduction histidine kinase